MTAVSVAELSGIKIDPLRPARQVLAAHIAALQQIESDLNLRLLNLASRIAACKGRIIITGLGKSAIAAQKISASLSAHSIAAFFLHAGDALHGNLGVIRHDDMLFAISVSGKSGELIPIIHYAQKVGAETIAISANSGEIVPRICDHVISIPRSEEGCAFGIAPFASTLATIAIGDALTVLAAERLQFSRTSMAELHPGGHIGQQLAPISETMICGVRMPMVDPACNIADIITEITAKGLGVTTVVDDQHRLLGLITDGDLRRHYDAVQNQTAENIMTKQPLCVDVNIDRHAAMVMMSNHRVNIIPVVGGDGITLVGLVHLQDLLRSGAILI